MHTQPPKELRDQRANRRERAAMSPAIRNARTCRRCNTVYRAAPTAAKCLAIHQRKDLNS